MQENPLRPVTKRFPQLIKDTKTEVLVVGGGFTGVLCAYFLQQAGYDAIVVEMDEVGSGASGASSGILYYGTGTNLVDAISLWGKETAQYIWQETAQSVKEIAELVEKNNLACGFRRPGALMVAQTEEEEKLLETEQRELHRIGIRHPLLAADGLKQWYPAQRFRLGLHVENCAQLYPALFAASLAEQCRIALYEHTSMQNFEANVGKLTVTTPQATIECDKIVFATNDFPVPPENSFGLEKRFVKENSVILASQMLTQEQMKKFYPQEIILWTMGKEYDIVYPHEGRLMLELYRLRNVKEKLAFFYPGFDFAVVHQWGSSWAKMSDQLPLAGEFQKNVFLAAATGDQGTTTGYTIAKYIEDMIEGQRKRYLQLADPKRLFDSPSTSDIPF